ncbi:Malonyl CoA-acyl carrier protein transacylase [Buchnera aphidicola (Cinara pseudotaxifoliae)]|uniref:Malonyl CoA-acyl carrier protein transacylase n=1 Tax=Buchnera aphidicola (Cinara pseudotaxifoliae) TaxID=655384 RepID=A0A451DH64_9GAMM|nr:acyltransferase domain-containing protein [Buchnera aphidicola]VFP85958.1 Malonyl CoA-acyl carrier protein transacylase [Buchnera aphidicola (Cinara pseudotaxifoliae)]
MKKISLIFPGYGLSNIDCLKLFFKKYTIIRKTFEEASDILHENIYNNCLKNKNNSLYLRKKIHLLIFISSVAIYKLLNQHTHMKPSILAGHSLGQYSALVCNNNILFQEALKIIQIRHKIMLLAIKDTRILTLVIIGLNYTLIKEICSLISNKKKVFVSIINSNTQVVITGHYSAVYTAGQIFKKQLYVKVIQLPIPIASHCILMKNYTKKFSSSLKKIKIFKGKYPIIDTYHATILTSEEDIYVSLLKQIYKIVHWKQCIAKIISMNIDIFIEIGLGQVLTNLNKEYRKVSSYSTNNNQKLLSIINILKKL